MPFITLNGAKLFYQTYGKKRPTHAPILLVHGSTQTGYSCWDKVAPLLAEDYFVIVPDCRGHGQSENPNMTYTFKEHAADMAGLIRALGFERAHIIGHSNGGNIVLVTLLEHPDVVQTCIPQAGNAWVSPDLLVKEPPLFDPDFIERERPLWMQEMVVLHAPLGKDYWRKLVKMTVDEIISEPNYTPEDLAKVTRPALVIQGETDRVNAENRHGQFIARHIPAAELWIPKGIGHTVHDEILTEWLERVTDFLARRGTDASEKLYRYRLDHHPDSRAGIFDPRLSADGVLSGLVLNPEMQDEILQLASPVENQLKILITQETPWALINRPIEDLRRKPSILAERISQARLSESARVIERDASGDWSFIRLEHDGYSGWVHTACLHLCAEDDVKNYRAMLNAIVSASLAEAWDGEMLVQKIPFAAEVAVTETRGADSWIQLPDGRKWKVRSGDLTPLEARPKPTAEGIQQTLNLIRRFMGIPYLWGGCTPYGYDCSGLAGTFYAFMSVSIPRDADQQFLAGEVIEKPEAGDLVFFGDADEDGDVHISHVGISLGGDEFIHSTGAAWGITVNTFDPNGKRYRKWLHENYRGTRRFR